MIFAATVVENQGFRVFLKAPEIETQTGPKGGPWVTKMAPRSAPGSARGAKKAPGAAKSDPGAPQEPPKRRTKGAKKPPVIVSALGVGSGGLREPF